MGAWGLPLFGHHYDDDDDEQWPFLLPSPSQSVRSEEEGTLRVCSHRRD